MKHFIKALRKNIIWFSISIQYLVAFFFIYASFVFPTPELKIATGGLAVAFAVMASTDIKDVKDVKKNRQDFNETGRSIRQARNLSF